MALTGAALKDVIGNVSRDGIQTLNAGTGRGYGDFLGFTANATPTMAPAAPSPSQP
jgi:hypothetical protein